MACAPDIWERSGYTVMSRKQFKPYSAFKTNNYQQIKLKAAVSNYQ